MEIEREKGQDSRPGSQWTDVDLDQGRSDSYAKVRGGRKVKKWIEADPRHNLVLRATESLVLSDGGPLYR
jgi:hypothetical protein